MIDPIIYILPTSLVQEKRAFVLSFIDKKRKEKAERYIKEKDQLLSLGAGFLLKKYLPEGEVEESAAGKPYLPNGPFFNLSHSGEHVVLAVHPSREVGIDIERIDETKLDAIRFVLNEREGAPTDLETLFRIWSNKESLVKCISTGLKSMKSMDGLPLEGERIIDVQRYYVKSMVFHGYSLSVSRKGKEPFNMNINCIHSLEGE